MKIQIMFIITGAYPEGGDNFKACRHICLDSNIKTDHKWDTAELTKKGQGCVNLSHGFIMETDDGKILFNWRDLAKWIEEKGLRPL